MVITSKNDIDKIKWTTNFFYSVVIHFLLFFAVLLLLNIQDDRLKLNPNFFFLETKQFEKTYDKENDQLVLDKQGMEKTPSEETLPENDQLKFISFSELRADTTELDQVYKESSLNVSIKYPKGWTFIDQSKSKKLDGVTFWAVDGVNDPPPYIHLEVVDKYLFNKKKFRYKKELKYCMAYYNDPEELAGQISQTVYLRTKSHEDFSIKLIMRGNEAFKSFQSRFFAVIESFKFGTSIF
jgi:hypothetical protein